MKKKIPLLAAIAVVLVIGLVFSLKRGAPTETAPEDSLLVPNAAADIYEATNRLEVTQGKATVKRAEGAEEEITQETTVEVGDTITVSEDGQATLYWFDRSISRLQGGTVLKIDQAAYSPKNISETNIGFELIKGEVWSKVKSLMDERSAFLGHAGNVVAGVRGSVFDLAINGDEVQVASIAHAMTVGQETITAGEWGRFQREDGKKIVIAEIPPEEFARDWYTDNQKSDEKEKGKELRLTMARMKKIIGAMPGDKDFDQKFAEFEAHLAGITDPVEKERLKAAMFALMRSLEVLPDDKLYDFRERLRDKLIDWETDEGRRSFLRKGRVESRIFELDDWVQKENLEGEKVSAHLERLKGEEGEMEGLFKTNPEFLDMAVKIKGGLDRKFPDLRGTEFFGRMKSLRTQMKPMIRVTPTTEPKEVIEREAPYYRGESNI